MTTDNTTALSGISTTLSDIYKIHVQNDGIGTSNNMLGNYTLDLSSSDFSTYTISNPDHYNNHPILLNHKGITMPEETDIKIGDFSLKESLARIEERLNLLTANTKLEAEWEELKQLGEQYRALEKQIMEKMNVWDLLKS